MAHPHPSHLRHHVLLVPLKSLHCFLIIRPHFVRFKGDTKRLKAEGHVNVLCWASPGGGRLVMWDERCWLPVTAPPAIVVWISSPVLSLRLAFHSAVCPPIAFPDSFNGLTLDDAVFFILKSIFITTNRTNQWRHAWALLLTGSSFCKHRCQLGQNESDDLFKHART